MSRVFTYLQKKETLTLNVVLGVFTYEMIEALKTGVMDPVYEAIIKPEMFELNINIGKSDRKKIQLGKLFYELLRWVIYVAFSYVLYETLKNGIFRAWASNLDIILALFVFLFLIKHISIVVEEKNKIEGEAILK